MIISWLRHAFSAYSDGWTRVRAHDTCRDPARLGREGSLVDPLTQEMLSDHRIALARSSGLPGRARMPAMDVQQGVFQNEFRAGPDQRIVVYHVTDTGEELNPVAIFAEIAEDAAKRAEQGQRIVAIAPLSTRHAGAWFSREGSGFETKASIAVVYEDRRP